MTITLDHQQIQYALKEFDIKEQDYYLLFDQSVYMVWCTTGSKAWELVTENSCVSLNYRNQWYYFDAQALKGLRIAMSIVLISTI